MIGYAVFGMNQSNLDNFWCHAPIDRQHSTFD